jgi:3-oxoacyl-[acyl-carrier protein] reductase
MTQKLQDRVAVITGAGGGFGEGIARHFAQLGARVVVADLRGDAAAAVAAAIEAEGGQALAVTVDVTSDAEVRAMVEATQARFGRLDILVNNAGTTHRNQPMLDVDEATFDRLYAVNVKSLYLTTRHAVPVMRAQGGGVIVNIASTAAERPRPGLVWYSGTKGAVVTLTKGMAVELAPDRIRVNAINPVMGETGLFADFLPGENTEATRARILATIPLGRFSRPLDIAHAAAFLASDEAAMVTGAALEVDGGRCI